MQIRQCMCACLCVCVCRSVPGILICSECCSWRGCRTTPPASPCPCPAPQCMSLQGLKWDDTYNPSYSLLPPEKLFFA
uniref:Putative secreted protein n=1 Tax=Anopheles marajoara TaxID=58244 RepID=A0A2M4CCI3_9DIPT